MSSLAATAVPPVAIPQNPVTEDGGRPQKRFYRQRAHCNPLSHNDAFGYPRRPSEMDWTGHGYLDPDQPQSTTDQDSRTGSGGAGGDVIQSATKEAHYPGLPPESAPDVLDIGCGFGGLTMALATLLPDNVILGMEIRAKVTEYVRLRILHARQEHPGAYQNCSVLRTNSMKFLPNYFGKASIEKLFFCFPDPHFKRKNHPRRIISERLLAEYAFVLKPGTGRLYCITDVQELHEWHVSKCDSHPFFRRLPDPDTEADPCVHAMRTTTEEGQKVERNNGQKYYAVYERLATPVSTRTPFDLFPMDDS